ncbi:MAG: hypothetical protein ACOY94_20225 [Bacillota bacterium]
MNSSVIRFGGTSAILAGIVYVAVGILFFLQPATDSVEATMQMLATNPLHHYLYSLSFAVIAALLLAVIMALTETLQHLTGLLRWAAAIGYIGCAGSVMSQLRLLKLAPLRASVYMEGDEMIRTAIQYNWVGNSLDPYGWLQFGAVGIWLLLTAYVVVTDGQILPRANGYLGMAVGAVHLAALVGINLGVPALQAASAVLGGILLGPAWAVWTGLLLRRRADQLDSLHRAA